MMDGHINAAMKKLKSTAFITMTTKHVTRMKRNVTAVIVKNASNYSLTSERKVKYQDLIFPWINCVRCINNIATLLQRTCNGLATHLQRNRYTFATNLIRL